MEVNKVYHADCFDILKTLPNNSVDAVITDPPYGINLSHWDKPVDIELFTSEAKRITTDFYVFFGQMPTVINWINACNDLHYLEHISWIKRNCNPNSRLSRGHESIFIYTNNKKNFYCKKGKYTDVKLPGILFDLVTIESIDRHIKDLQLKIKRGYGTLNTSQNANQLKRKYNATDHERNSPEEVNYSNVWSFLPPTNAQRNQTVEHQHPTQKPLDLIKRLIEMCSPVGGTILDPFGGSGTTAIACLELGRNYIVIEKELDYYNIICDRISDWHSKPKQQELILE